MRTNALANEKRDEYSKRVPSHAHVCRLRHISNNCFYHFYCVCYDNSTFVRRRVIANSIANIQSYI